ncbi:MAG: hypothetical protein DMD81_14275 [Candidatus Rokuibacteriota bacterium]|nr:MAG: hypothetical protein DMD81_14275 [Candidatus Rokubacteria bacterium]
MTLVLLRGLRLTLVCLAFVATVTEAADWGGIAPGTSTKDTVQKIFGAPSRTEQKKLEGYDVSDWVYEGPRAPGGVVRMTIEFGLLAGQNFKPDIVRVLRLDPAPGVFNRRAIIAGWGIPYAAGREEQTPEFYYEEGLLVLFDKQGWNVERLVFTPPQPRQKP